jgi:hypothetical protein
MDAIPSTTLPTETGAATLFVTLGLSRSTRLVALHSPITDELSRICCKDHSSNIASNGII